jgi:anti-anti-sigma factor
MKYPYYALGEQEPPAVTRLRGMFGRDSPQSNRADATRGRVAHLNTDAAWTRAVHRPGELAVETQHDDDAVIVVLAGEFDLGTAEPVREALNRAMGEARRRVIIDLGAVTFIDSSGLHAILDAYKLCRDVAPTLTIRPGPPNVQKVFESTNLLDRLPFEISD